MMGSAPVGEDRNLLYALSWNSAQDAKVAFDAHSRTIIDLNPAAERLTGYGRDELVGRDGAILHPESERERIKGLIRGASGEGGRFPDTLIQRRDGSAIPVSIASSETWMLGGRMIGICVFRDISEQIEREQRLSAQNWALKAYADAAQALGQARSAEHLLQAICEAIVHEPIYLAAWVGRGEDGPGKPVRVAASAGRGISYLEGLRLSWDENEPEGQGPTGVCIRTGTVQILDDTEGSPVYGPWRERARSFGIRSSVSIPLGSEMSSGTGWKGALIVYAERPHAFAAAPVEVFQRLAAETVHGLRSLNQGLELELERRNLARTQAELMLALSGMVGPLITAMEMRDPYTAGHQARVAEIACAIGREIGWERARMDGLRVAALVHDIGKIAIPSEILTKPGKLNAAERAMICLHPETGYAILKDVTFAWPIAQIVRQHHEKLDGSGYPAGLKSDQILPEAKILAVADVVEAMASFRPYRAGIALERVLEQIESEAGRQLDEQAVETCVRLFRERNFTVPGWAQTQMETKGIVNEGAVSL
jgi:PAS domain S-box-containing protein/putative nucleotidyltransferase with HDIG domain